MDTVGLIVAAVGIYEFSVSLPSGALRAMFIGHVQPGGIAEFPEEREE